MSVNVLNNRGQLQNIVDLSVAEGERREQYFKKYMLNKQNINLFKKSQYKPYDFVPDNDKTLKIEFKTVNASINTYTNVFLGIDKISYYLYRKVKHPNFRFFIVYGFYELNEATSREKITYLCDEIDLDKYIKNYNRQIVYNKKHIQIPVKTLKPLRELINILKKPI